MDGRIHGKWRINCKVTIQPHVSVVVFCFTQRMRIRSESLVQSFNDIQDLGAAAQLPGPIAQMLECLTDLFPVYNQEGLRHGFGFPSALASSS